MWPTTVLVNIRWEARLICALQICSGGQNKLKYVKFATQCRAQCLCVVWQRDMEKAADTQVSPMMDSRCGLGLRYRAVDIRDLNWDKKENWESRHELISWLIYQHLPYKHLGPTQIATEKEMPVNNSLTGLSLQIPWFPLTIQSSKFMIQIRSIFPTTHLWPRINCSFLINTLISKCQLLGKLMS